MPRLAREGEAEALRALVRGAYAHYVPRLGREPFPMTDDYAARIRAGQAWVEEDAEGRILGVLVLEDTPEGLLLDNVAVARPGQGTGKRLLRFVEEEALRRGHPRVWLYTNEKMTENIALYTQLGFVETHRGEEQGFRRVFMEKRLA